MTGTSPFTSTLPDQLPRLHCLAQISRASSSPGALCRERGQGHALQGGAPCLIPPQPASQVHHTCEPAKLQGGACPPPFPPCRVYWKWYATISYLRYSWGALMVNQVGSRDWGCGE